jgi:hypothetical protein
VSNKKTKLTGKTLGGYAAIVIGAVCLTFTGLTGIVQAMRPHAAILIMAAVFGVIGAVLVYVGIRIITPAPAQKRS